MHLVIIGGGIAGIAAAYRLLHQGASVTVVDNGRRGAATRAAAGVISPVSVQATTADLAGLRLEAVRHYRELVDLLSADAFCDHGVTNPGQVVIEREGTAALESLERRFADLAQQPGGGRLGRLEHLDAAQLRVLVPWITPSVKRGICISSVLQADGRRLLRSLTEAVCARGGAIVHGLATPQIRRGRVTGVSVGDEVLGCDAVILCTGAWAQSRYLSPSLRIPVRPERGQLVHLRARVTGQPVPIVSTPDGDYAISFPRGRVVVGATREAKVTAPYPTPDGIQQVLRNAQSVVAQLGDFGFIAARAGLRPQSVDGAPVVGPDPRVAGAYHVQALGSLGLTAGPFLGARCADAALGVKVPEIAAFAPDRVVVP